MQKEYVRTLFNSIASRYDLLNHLLSAGIDAHWRRRAVEHLRGIHPKSIIDVATGTGDFALAGLRLDPEEIIGVDIAEEMLSLGRKKIAARGLNGVITLEKAEAEKLPFEDCRFDAAMVAFGARNFENLDAGIAEMRRVLRPGGKILVLEFSQPSMPFFRQAYLWYFRRILPIIGKVISGSPEAYTYLPRTVMAFPQGKDFLEVLTAAGFRFPEEERLTFGIASVYTGVR